MSRSQNPYCPVATPRSTRIDSKFWRFQVLFAIAGGVLGLLYPLMYGIRLVSSVWSTQSNDGTPAFVGMVAMIAAPVGGLALAFAAGLIGVFLDLLWFIVTGRYSLVSAGASALCLNHPARPRRFNDSSIDDIGVDASTESTNH